MTKSELLKLLEAVDDNEELFVLNHKAQPQPLEAFLAFACYRTNGAMDVLEPDNKATIEQDKTYCDKEYLNIAASHLTGVFY